MSEFNDLTTPTPLFDFSAKTHNLGFTWRIIHVINGLLAFFDPCYFCFPDGEVNVDTVIRSNCPGDTLHSPEPAEDEEVIDR